ncbi:septin and tuftelin-interacting protein 1 homolog 1-like isoform X2 [Lolium rigidum]|uniref:septin and tuftelin-interacting protein 1 homolog 1-like isoform X2 n=2 Tax=Lolium rigidum TaxID=89674 RepID=UPI001F5C16F2|nr:septin and tuftelin-interacting protein 1 homolog 1-like isoform X2 [Lolium rigidum]
MMANMGFKSGTGLGKDGQGIVAPLEGVSRPAHAGLGSVEEHRPFFHGKENLPPPPPPPAEEEPEPPRWSRKAAAARNSRAPGLVLSKSALLTTRAEQVQPMVVDRVIDMRGPQPRVLTDMTGLNDEQEMDLDEDLPMPELQYNLQVLVDQAAAGIRGLDEQLQREKEDVASLTREKNRLAEHEASHGHELQVMEAITGALEQVRADEAAGVLTPEALLDTFRELKTRHEEVFDLCGLAWIACEFVRPLLVRACHGWQPLRDPSFGLELMTQWKDFLQQHPQHYDFRSDYIDPYTQLLLDVILPVVRASGANSWDARDPEPMLRFLESWEELLPPVVLESTLEDVIMPKLSAAIDSWDRENVPIHAWVHPWLPILGQSRTETLCHSVRYKLSTGVLCSWQSHDASAYAALSPWKGVFDPASWEAMITRYIVPKLKLALQELQISPAVNSQELDQFNDRVMIWSSAIPAYCMVHLLEVEFFSKWLLVLYHWLRSTDPDFDEVVYWYKSWRGILPPELIAHRRVRMLLAAGLVMMDNAAEGREVLLPGAAREATGCPEAAEDQQFDAAQRAPPQQVPGAAMEDLSFKDRILAYAEEHGLKFMPSAGKFYNGVPVYEFGCIRVRLDSVKGLLFAQVQGSWSSVTLVQLMEMNRMATPC